MLQLIDREGLHLLNRADICKGMITRVDPRNGTRSTLDLAICNEFMIKEVLGMVIDEEEEFKPMKYAKKCTKTDHNSIVVDIKVNKAASVKCVPFFNTRCEIGKAKFKEEMQDVGLDDLFNDIGKINADYTKLIKIWDQVLSKSFKKVRPSTNRVEGVDDNIRTLVQEERIVKKEWGEGQDKEKKLSEIRSEISSSIATNIEHMMEEKVQKIENSQCKVSTSRGFQNSKKCNQKR